MGNVLVNEESLRAIADAIRVKNGSTDKYLPSEMPSAIEGIQSGGEDYARYAKIIQFTDASELPKKVVLNLDTVTSLNSLCSNTSIEELTINLKQTCTTMQRMIYPTKANSLKKIVLNFDTSKVTNMQQTFNWIATADAEIVGELDLSSVTITTSMFSYSTGLKEIRFKKETIKMSIPFQSCEKLSAESIQSIIDGLAIVETTQTLTLHANVKKKLTEEQISQITSKNWTLA